VKVAVPKEREGVGAAKLMPVDPWFGGKLTGFGERGDGQDGGRTQMRAPKEEEGGHREWKGRCKTSCPGRGSLDSSDIKPRKSGSRARGSSKKEKA